MLCCGQGERRTAMPALQSLPLFVSVSFILALSRLRFRILIGHCASKWLAHWWKNLITLRRALMASGRNLSLSLSISLALTLVIVVPMRSQTPMPRVVLKLMLQLRSLLHRTQCSASSFVSLSLIHFHIGSRSCASCMPRRTLLSQRTSSKLT